MKITHKLFLLLSISCSIITPKEVNLTQKNTILIFDLDDVLVARSFFLTTLWSLQSLFGNYTKDANGSKEILHDTNGNLLNGLTFHILYHGMQKPYLAPYAAWLAEELETSQHLIQGTYDLCRYLKEKKGYTIVFATNKDRPSYDLAAHVLGKDLTDLTDTVFVAHPGNNDAVIAELQDFADRPTTSISYKKLFHDTLTIQPTEIIFHAPSKKPTLAYYQYVEQKLGINKNMIFVDDKKENIDGFAKLPSISFAQRIGIQFKNPQQLADEFVNLGILSETEDQPLLEKIRYSGIRGKIQLFFDTLFGKDNNLFPLCNC